MSFEHELSRIGYLVRHLLDSIDYFYFHFQFAIQISQYIIQDDEY